MWLRKLLILPPVLLGVAVLVYMTSSKKAPQQTPPKERITQVRYIQVSPSDFLPRAKGFGSVSPARVWNAVAQVSGQIEYVDPGFKKGAVLLANTEIIRISKKDYEIAINQAKANIRSAEAKLKELGVTEKNNQAALKIEEQSLKIKKQELARKKALLQRGTIAQASVDQEQRDLLAQEKRVVDLQNTIRLLPTQIEAQKSQIEINNIQLETAKRDLGHTSIRLPFSARISEANVEVTQYVGVGTTLGKSDGIKTAEIEAQFPQGHLRRMLNTFPKTAKQPLTLRADTFERITKKLGLYAIVRLKSGLQTVEWRAKVLRTSDTIDPKTRTVGVIVAVEDHYKKVVPGIRPPLVKGMFVEVELRTKVQPNQVIVPRSAIHNGNVYILNNENRLEIKPVTVALSMENFSVIKNGLKAGDKVIVSDLVPAIPKMLLNGHDDKDLSQNLLKAASPKQGDNK